LHHTLDGANYCVAAACETVRVWNLDDYRRPSLPEINAAPGTDVLIDTIAGRGAVGAVVADAVSLRVNPFLLRAGGNVSEGEKS
jgi:hypothetical protein